MFFLLFFLTILLLAALEKISIKILFSFGIRNTKKLYILAVSVHELFHFIAALLVLKWPKFEPIRIENKGDKIQIQGGVQVKHYKYRDLLYNILHGEFILSSIYLVWEFFSKLLIGIAPVLAVIGILSLMLFLGNFHFSFTSIPSWDIAKLLILVPSFPIIAFLSITAQPSIQDLKNAFVPLLVLLFINNPFLTSLLEPVVIFLGLMLIALCVFYLFLAVILKKRKFS